VKLPAYLFNSSLVVRKGTNEVEYLPSVLWAERLDTGFQRVLAADLAIVLPTDRIHQSAWQRDAVAAEIYVTLEQFDVDASGRECSLPGGASSQPAERRYSRPAGPVSRAKARRRTKAHQGCRHPERARR